MRQGALETVSRVGMITLLFGIAMVMGRSFSHMDWQQPQKTIQGESLPGISQPR